MLACQDSYLYLLFTLPLNFLPFIVVQIEHPERIAKHILFDFVVERRIGCKGRAGVHFQEPWLEL